MSSISFEIDLATLEIAHEEASYQADSAVLEAARAAKRAHDREQVEEMREKSSHLLMSGIVEGAMLVGSGVMQGCSAASQYDADLDRARTAEQKGISNPVLTATGAASQRNANVVGAVGKGLDGAAKCSDLVFNSFVADDDADAARAAHLADDDKWRADDAAASRQRAQATLDQNLGAVQEMLRADEDTMRNLLLPA
jgi:hypothetical protein